MMDQTFKVGQSYFPNHPVKPKVNETIEPKAKQFNQLLNEQINHLDDQELKFSLHAKQRLDKRGINLNSTTIGQLNDAVNRAAEKGVKDSLILMKDLAFVVNVQKKVVITTVDQASMKEHIFTNIDGAIIL